MDVTNFASGSRMVCFIQSPYEWFLTLSADGSVLTIEQMNAPGQAWMTPRTVHLPMEKLAEALSVLQKGEEP
jgi:hypothetical protein